MSASASSDAAPRAKHDVVVVGNGPVGSAVARHIAEAGKSVLVLDGGDTLTSASDDAGRIVRPLHAAGSPRWTAGHVEPIAHRSLAPRAVSGCRQGCVARLRTEGGAGFCHQGRGQG